MNDFYRTRMGQVFFESTMPRLVAELARLNDNLEALRKERAVRVDDGCRHCGRAAGQPTVPHECPWCSPLSKDDDDTDWDRAKRAARG